MQTHQVKRNTPNKKMAAVGRGGKRGKTSGRGTKGQNARAGRKKLPEMRDFIKRIPKLRGRGKSPFKSFEVRPALINVENLNVFNNGEAVNPQLLVEKGVISRFKGNVPSVKILGNGELTKKVAITDCVVSAGAKSKIEKAGGSVK